MDKLYIFSDKRKKTRDLNVIKLFYMCMEDLLSTVQGLGSTLLTTRGKEKVKEER